MREGEEPLAVGDHAGALAVRADAGRRARLSTRAAADVACGLDVDGHADLDALERVLEGDADARLQVCAALGPWASGSARAAPEERAEVAEQVGEVAEVDVLEAPASGEALRAVLAKPVVRLALLGVREDVVGALDVLEPLLGRGVVGVAVGVQFARELSDTPS